MSNRNSDTKNYSGGTLLFVTDLTIDCNESLESACQLADCHGVPLEMIHVVDMEHAPSRPDAQMGIQYRLETMASRLKKFKRNVVSVLLFGSAEVVISQRAAQCKAKLIAFAPAASSSSAAQQGLIRRLMRRVKCPVVVVPRRVA